MEFLQEGKCVDMQRLRQYCQAAREDCQPQLWREIKAVLLQHSLQLLLQDLRGQALLSGCQASSLKADIHGDHEIL